jgi:hypothetical protein
MVSHIHSTNHFGTAPNAAAPNPVSDHISIVQRRLVEAALGIGILSIVASGVLLVQMRSLDQKIQEVAVASDQKIQEVAVASGNGQEHTVLKTQVSNLSKTLQTQTSRVDQLSKGVSNTNRNVAELDRNVAHNIAQLNTKLNAAKQPTQAIVTIGVSAPQDIGHGFWVTDLMAIPTNRGTRLVGNLVNTTAVKYTGVIFSTTLGNAPAKMLSIPEIDRGGLVSFSADFPDITPDQAVKGRIDYVSANMVIFGSL